MDDASVTEPQVEFAVLADAATAAEGKLYVHGAGWDTIWANAFPVSHPSLAIALRITVPWTRANQPFELDIDLEDEDGASILAELGSPRPRQTFELARPEGVPPGSDLGLVYTFTFNGLPFTRAGGYAFVLRLDGREANRLRFREAAPAVSGD